MEYTEAESGAVGSKEQSVTSIYLPVKKQDLRSMDIVFRRVLIRFGLVVVVATNTIVSVLYDDSIIPLNWDGTNLKLG
jgi:hypothetical protein